MKQGYIKLYRKTCQSKMWLSEPFTRAQAWIDLILITNHKDGYIRVRGNRVDVKRGQCGWSQARLAVRWQWSRGKVKRFLNELETEQQIVQHRNNITSCILITNYEMYQGDGTTDGQQTDSRRTADGQQTDTNKNVKNVKKERMKEGKEKPLAVRPDDISKDVWDDFLMIRKQKRAPFTATAFKGMITQAGKAKVTVEKAMAIACERGWQSFNAKWYDTEPKRKPDRIQRDGFEHNDYNDGLEVFQ